MQSEFDKFVEKVAEFEGCPTYDGVHCKAYKDATGKMTIGYGITNSEFIAQDGHLTVIDAKHILRDMLKSKYSYVSRLTKHYGYIFNDFQKMALTDFCYNLGTGNLLNLLKNGKRPADVIAMKILEYNKARVNGVLKPLAGLTKRRAFEHEYFCRDMEKTSVEKISIKAVQELVNDVFEKKNINKQIDVDGLIGQETLASLHRILTEYLKELN